HHGAWLSRPLECCCRNRHFCSQPNLSVLSYQDPFAAANFNKSNGSASEEPAFAKAAWHWPIQINLPEPGSG
ncbi:MAG: hypothetical protein WCD20_05215, partial [Rhodomicrobium sp.]